MYKTKYHKEDILLASNPNSMSVCSVVIDKEGKLKKIYIKDGTEFTDTRGRKYIIKNKTLRRFRNEI